jgi:hypothetical protein
MPSSSLGQYGAVRGYRASGNCRGEDHITVDLAGSSDHVVSPVTDLSAMEFKVGKITSVEKHPEASGLYVEKIDLGRLTVRYEDGLLCSSMMTVAILQANPLALER